MPIKVTLEGVLDDYWGADEAFKDGGKAAIRDLLEEDLMAMWENLALKVEVVPDPPADHQ